MLRGLEFGKRTYLYESSSGRGLLCHIHALSRKTTCLRRLPQASHGLLALLPNRSEAGISLRFLYYHTNLTYQRIFPKIKSR